MVFYFTGTGNSLFAAKELEEKQISIPQAVHDEKKVYKDERIGIVCPIYGHEMPLMVKEFLREATFQTAYFYVVLTYGNIHGGAAELAEKYLQSIGKEAQYINTIKMVDNFLPGFDMEEQLATLPEKKVEKNLASIKADIDGKKVWKPPITQEDRGWHKGFLERSAGIASFGMQQLYKVTDDCIGCGICMNVCPAGCIHLEGQKAVHGIQNCQMCMACIHHCPQNAIRLCMPEKNPNARYHNPDVRLTEIVEANRQDEGGATA